mmetsp:Transcript_102693/g.162350  ORF Transcript_102693/g.162350 Transcript_102693/m.162350 type:complete len:254 (-) Transcript_102693:312-1073(-)
MGGNTSHCIFETFKRSTLSRAREPSVPPQTYTESKEAAAELHHAPWCMFGKELQLPHSTEKNNADPIVPLLSSPPQTQRVVPPIAQQAALRLADGIGGSFVHRDFWGSKASTEHNGLHPALPPHTYNCPKRTSDAAQMRASNIGGRHVHRLLSTSNVSAALRYTCGIRVVFVPAQTYRLPPIALADPHARAVCIDGTYSQTFVSVSKRSTELRTLSPLLPPKTNTRLIMTATIAHRRGFNISGIFSHLPNSGS